MVDKIYKYFIYINITMVSKKQIKEVEELLKTNNQLSGAPFSACTFGNAFTNKEIFIGAGYGRKCQKINKDMYWRDASMTKLLGLLMLGTSLEDGIISSIDDKVSKYIPEFSRINSYVSGSTPVLDSNGNQTFDKYGTPRYTQIITTEPGLGDTITIKMLLLCNSGMAYQSPYAIGFRRSAIDLYKNTQSGQNYIAFIQNIENTNGSIDMQAAYYNHQEDTYTESILRRIASYPLLYKPGSSTFNTYDIGISVIGGVIGGGLKLKGIKKNGAEYCKERIFEPMGIKNFWLCAGSLNPPCDAKKKITESIFVRKNNIDGQAGPYVQLNTLYRVFDKQAEGDGFVIQAKNMFLRKKNKDAYKTDILAGGYDCSGCGTMHDFCLFLQLLINKGVNISNSKRILTEQTINWLLSPKYIIGQQLTSFGPGTQNLLGTSEGTNQNWIGGASNYYTNSPLVPFPSSSFTFRWGGYWGTSFYFDISTGNYMMSGTQVSGASWYLPAIPTGTTYQPNAVLLWKILAS
jgi:CubicO group peptidase (beta-lactamase class C family)